MGSLAIVALLFALAGLFLSLSEKREEKTNRAKMSARIE